MNGNLDAEEASTYNLTLMARDVTRNRLNSTAVFSIEVHSFCLFIRHLFYFFLLKVREYPVDSWKFLGLLEI